MRFLVLTAPSLADLASILDEMILGTGRVVGYSKSGKTYEALIDMYPTHVITNDDLMADLDDNDNKHNTIALSA